MFSMSKEQIWQLLPERYAFSWKCLTWRSIRIWSQLPHEFGERKVENLCIMCFLKLFLLALLHTSSKILLSDYGWQRLHTKWLSGESVIKPLSLLWLTADLIFVTTFSSRSRLPSKNYIEVFTAINVCRFFSACYSAPITWDCLHWRWGGGGRGKG